MPITDKISASFVRASTIFQDGREEDLHSYVFSQDLSTLMNEPRAVLRAIDDYAETNKRLMTFAQPKLALSRQVLEAMQPKPKVILELGTYLGYSAIAWGEMLRAIHSGKTEGCKVYTCELDPKFAAIARDFIDLAGLQDMIEVVVGPSCDSLKALRFDGHLSKVDMIFFDHWEEAYLPDLKLCEELGILRRGSILVADNTDIPGAPRYLEYLRAGGSGETGAVQYKTKSYTTKIDRGPTAVEVSVVIQ